MADPQGVAAESGPLEGTFTWLVEASMAVSGNPIEVAQTIWCA